VLDCDSPAPLTFLANFTINGKVGFDALRAGQSVAG